mmetsp:Transcript_27864/g.66198  ORF Transcript_27864/g.66198 Transcript_27864/m.66198 type:complete len:241 (-) Transcript_27864:369-1091(-)
MVMDSFLDDGLLQDLVDGWPLARVLGDHPVDEAAQILAVARAQWGVLPTDDLVDQELQAARFKRMLEGGHLVEKAAERPYVTLLVILLALADLWREVVRRPDRGGCKVVRVVEHLGDAKVAELQDPSLGDEHVLGLEVPVQDLPVVHMLQPKEELHCPVQDLLLWEKRAFPPLQRLVEVAFRAVVHDDAKYAPLKEGLLTRDDVRMLEGLQQLCLLKGSFLFLLWHSRYVDFFQDKLCPV